MALQPYSTGAAGAVDPHKRKNVLTGYAEEVVVSDITFNTQHRKHLQRTTREEGPKAKRQKGDAGVVSGPGAYQGPWAKFEGEDDQYDIEEESLASDEEYVEDELAPTRPGAPMPKASTAYAADDATGGETSEFHGSAEFDYQGRTYMHVPQDLDVDLHKEPGSTKNYIPSKLLHTWRSHTKAITSLNFFPNSGHLLLSSSADSKVKIWDVYHERELLRTYSGHTRSVTATDFSPSGTAFLTASFDRQMKLWDTETGKCTARFSTGKIPHVIKFHPGADTGGNEFLAGMSDNKIVQFDVRQPPGGGDVEDGDNKSNSNSKPTQEYDHHLGPVNTITFVDESRRFITTSDDKSLRAWEYNIPVPIKFIAEPYMYSMVRAAPHPSGKYVAFQSGDNQIVVYAAGDRFRQNRKKGFKGHNSAGHAIDLDISPDGQFVMSGDSGGYVCFWDWKTCKLYHKMVAVDKGKGPVVCAKWHPQETSKVVTAGLEGAIRYWD